MSEKLQVWICFGGDSNLATVEEGLKKITARDNIENYHLCFLSRRIVNEKGFSTDIVDLLEKYLGDKAIWHLDKYENFETAIANINKERVIVAKLVNKLVVLDSRNAKGVCAEIIAYSEKDIEML